MLQWPAWPRSIARVAATLGVALAVSAAVIAAAAADRGPPARAPGDGESSGQAPPAREDAAPPTPPDAVLVRLDQQVRPEAVMSPGERAAQRRAIGRGQAEVAAAVRARGGQVRRAYDTLPLLSATVPPARQAALAEHDAVAAVVADRRVERALDDNVPLVGATADAVTGAGLSGDGVAVAIIDDGIQAAHEFFADDAGVSRVVAEACFLEAHGDSCPDGSDQQEGPGAAEPLGANRHGLHVAGIAAGSSPAGGSGPERGMAPQADVLAANVFGDDGFARTSDIVAALEWAHEQALDGGLDLAAANLSLGGSPMTPEDCAEDVAPAYDDVVANLRAVGALTVAAAGNHGNRHRSGAPACIDDVVSVAASDVRDRIARFTNAAADVDLIAPGVDVRSAGRDDGYAVSSGTSMSAPMVAGAAALVRQADPGADAGALLAALTTSPVTVDDDRGGGEVTGLARLDVPAALHERDVVTLTASTTTVTTPANAEHTIDLAGLVRRDAADDELDFAVAGAPAALDVSLDAADLVVTVPAGTADGDYRVEWTVDDGATTASATVTVVVSPWQQRASAPVRRLAEWWWREARSAATDADGRIYILGGVVSVDGTLAASDRVDRYDPARDAWDTVAPLSAEATNVAATSDAQGRIYALHSQQEVERFDPDTGEWEQLAPLDVPRRNLAATTDGDGRVYAIGGREPDSLDTTLTAVERFDPGVGEWERVADLATPRELLATATDAQGRVYAIGGQDWSVADPHASVERFDPGVGEWEPVAPLEVGGRMAAGAARDGGCIATVGGYQSPLSFQRHDDVERYTPAGNAWRRLPGLPREHPQSAVAAGGGAVHVTGDFTHRLVEAPPDPGRIAGTVTDSRGEPVSGAQVTVTGPDDAAATTDADGGYAVEVEPGGYTVRVTHGDFVAADHEPVGVAQCATTVDTDFELRPLVDVVAIEPADAEVPAGVTEAFTATATHTDGSQADVTGDATWSSTAPDVATVADGQATGHEPGTAELSAELDGHTATATLTVSPPQVTGLAVEPGDAALVTGGTRAFTATATHTDDSQADVTGDATWSSTAPDVATVADGQATGHEPGTAELSAELDGHTATATLSVSPEPGVARIAGANRFATAARLSAATFEPGVDRVYVATGGDFADALTGGVAAARAKAPVLLAATDTVPAATADELARLDPGEVVVLGGRRAVSGDVADGLADAAGAPVRRLAGVHRFATAAEISRHAFPGGADTVFVATGLDFPDALAGVPAAAAAPAPLLLATDETVPGATAAELDRLDPDRVVVLGGHGVVGAGVEADLAAWGAVQRLAGATRFATAAGLAGELDEPHTVYVATGLAFADALAAGAVAGAQDAPVLLVATDTVPAATAEALARIAPTRIVVMGGTSAVTRGVARELTRFAAE